MLTGADIVLLSLAIGLAASDNKGDQVAAGVNLVLLLILYACLLIWR